MTALDREKFGTDKSASYLAHLEKYLAPLKDKEISLLELGIYKGASLRLWNDYFKRGVIAGLDFADCGLWAKQDRIRVYRGRQEDTALLDKIREETAPGGFDVIIDDCSHFGELTRISFWHLFLHHLKPGGIYVIEDWLTAFWSDWPDGKPLRTGPGRKKTGMRTRLRGLLQAMTDSRWLEGAVRRWPKLKYLPVLALCRQRFPSHRYGMAGVIKQLIDEFAKETGSRRMSRTGPGTEVAKIEIYPSQVFVFKKPLPVSAG